jgi:putative ABC transport system permease protein
VIISISFFLALVCAELFIPVFETYAAFEIQTSWFLQPRYFIWILLLFLFITVMGALYPAFYLSRLPVAQVLSPKSNRNHRIGWFRKALIILQFAFAVFMLIATVTVQRQLDFIQSYDTGIDAEKLLTFQLPRDTNILNRLPFLRDQMEESPEVSSASFSGTLPSLGQGELLFRIEQDGMLEDMAVKEMFVDESFLETMGVELVTGRNFDRGRPSDASKAFLINESGARHFGWGLEAALGKRVQWGLYSDNKAANDGEIVGVYKDFNFESLHSEIEPLILIYSPKQGQLLTMRSPERISANNLASIRDHWASLTGSLPNDYFFLSDKIDDNYKTELQMLEIFWIFSGFSIVIALLGVFAMSYFYAIEKTKEIGIRIVLGASLKDLALFLSRDITPLFVVASLIASVAAFWGLSYWLNNFAFHISLNATYFVGAIVVVATLLLTIILLQTLKTRGSQPIRALRFE